MKERVIMFTGCALIATAVLFGQGHSDPVLLSGADGNQEFAQVEYNINADVYLAAWEDGRSIEGTGIDIYGQLISGDGTLIGENFIVCNAEGSQYWPRIAADPVNNLFLVVFEDQRNGVQNGDVRGVFVDTEGNIVDAPSSEADHSFGISTNMGHIYTCSVAFNTLEQVYLVVWGDSRNSPDFNYVGVDVYGQLIGSDGTLLTPPDPAGPAENFPIDHSEQYDASVADVTYNQITNEFFVLYGTSLGYVLGQRVDSHGRLIGPEGTAEALAKSESVQGAWPAMQVSDHFNNGPDCFQARVASRTEYNIELLAKSTAAAETEVLAVWKGMNANTQPGYYNDGYGQRIGFFRETDRYVAKYISLSGEPSEAVPSNFALSLQPNFIDPLDVAYGAQDDEFLVAWGDPRNGGGRSQMDLYAQRLGIQESNAMILLADDRVSPVSETENIAVDTSDFYQGSLLGVAHNPLTNEFLCAYVDGDVNQSEGVNVVFRLFQGSAPIPPSKVAGRLQPGDFTLYQNTPNPFNPGTSISFSIPVRAAVTVMIYDIQGRQIAVLLNENREAGPCRVVWQGQNDAGEKAATGVYVCQVNVDGKVKSNKMMLIR